MLTEATAVVLLIGAVLTLVLVTPVLVTPVLETPELLELPQPVATTRALASESRSARSRPLRITDTGELSLLKGQA